MYVFFKNFHNLTRQVRLCNLSKYKIINIRFINKSTPDYENHFCRYSSFMMEIFKGVGDRFDGVTVDSREEACDIQKFSSKLDESLKSWKANERRGIWFKVDLKQVDWVAVLAKKGFKFHHAQDDFVMMYLWLPDDETCNIPGYAHTMLGVGAVVVNDKRQVLVVAEKSLKYPHWKLPGGYVERGENLIDAAKREVLEETNIQTEFQSVLALRHAHHGMFGCSDIYTVVCLRALTEEIRKSEQEIAKCQWMDINEYLHHEHVHELNRFIVRKYLDYEKNNVKFHAQHGIHERLNVPYVIYHILTEDEESPGS